MGLFRRKPAAPTAPAELDVDGVRDAQHDASSPDPFLAGLGEERPTLLGLLMDGPVPEMTP